MTEEEYSDVKKLKVQNKNLYEALELMQERELDIFKQIESLRKENEEVKAKYEELNDFSKSQVAKLLIQKSELKKQIIGLEDNLRGHKARKNHYMKECEELRAQIEKMKCCGNCKHNHLCTIERTKRILKNDFNDFVCKNYNRWELEK